MSSEKNEIIRKQEKEVENILCKLKEEANKMFDSFFGVHEDVTLMEFLNCWREYYAYDQDDDANLRCPINGPESEDETFISVMKSFIKDEDVVVPDVPKDIIDIVNRLDSAKAELSRLEKLPKIRCQK